MKLPMTAVLFVVGSAFYATLGFATQSGAPITSADAPQDFLSMDKSRDGVIARLELPRRGELRVHFDRHDQDSD